MSRPAEDGFESYYTEKLWELIPAFYRDEDGFADNPDVLRELIAIMARAAMYLRRDTDRLWEDPFIEDCDDWAVPYIGDLLGTRMVSALDLRGRRVDVAKTLYYRRRKGTLRVLEELISDIAGWEGCVTEAFRRLARAAHGLDAPPGDAAGRDTNTPPGGYADLRRPGGAERASGPFDEYFHSADVRRNRGGTDGRLAIPKVLFWLYRIPALKLAGVMPELKADAPNVCFDPSGRAIHLFARRGREESFDWEAWRSLREWEAPAPIRCRLLGDARFEVTDSVVAALAASGVSKAALTDLAKLDGEVFVGEAALAAALATLASAAELRADPAWTGILQQALVQECGKSALLTSFVPPASTEPKSIRVTTGGVEISSERIVAGALDASAPAPVAPGKDLVIDAERGECRFLKGKPPRLLRVDYYYGFPGPLGAGSYDRSAQLARPTAPLLTGGGTLGVNALAPGSLAATGVTQFDDSSTWTKPTIAPVVDAVIQAANLQRPYLRIPSDWTVTAAPGTASLTLDGLWIGSAGGSFALILAGDFGTVTVRRCTLDPGGPDAAGKPIAPVQLIVAGHLDQLIIDRCVCGPISTTGSGLVEQFVCADSVVQSVTAGLAAIDLPRAHGDVQRTTVFGDVLLDRIDASEALITGIANITDTQNGCFRFSAAGVGSRVPHPYESHYIDDVGHFFTSRVFGHYAYAQLSQSAPDFLSRGAENGSGIGAYSSLLDPIRLDSLQTKVDEYLPFGLIPVYLFVT